MRPDTPPDTGQAEPIVSAPWHSIAAAYTEHAQHVGHAKDVALLAHVEPVEHITDIGRIVATAIMATTATTSTAATAAATTPPTPAADTVGPDVAADNGPGVADNSPKGSCRDPVAYPPELPSYPAIELQALLDAHAVLIARIKVCFGVERDTFEREVMTLIRRYAAYVHLLPATPDDYFNQPGGLLQLGLETAFFALQGTDAHIFSGRSTITTRRHLEPRWRLATFIGGLCSDIHRTIGRLTVTYQRQDAWPSYIVALQPWLQTRGAQRYHLKWHFKVPENPGLSLFALPLVVPATTLQHLAEANSVIVPHLMASLASTTQVSERNILDQLVRRSSALVIDRYLRASADRCGKVEIGAHVERFLVAGLRRLIATEPSWQPNAERSRVWFGPDGLFIVWPNAAADLGKLLDAEQLSGMPHTPQAMQDVLIAAGVLMARPDGRSLWTIEPPGASTAMEAVKLSAPDLLLSGLDPRMVPLPHPLASEPIKTTVPIKFTDPIRPGLSTIPLASGRPAEDVPNAPNAQNTQNAASATRTRQVAGGVAQREGAQPSRLMQVPHTMGGTSGAGGTGGTGAEGGMGGAGGDRTAGGRGASPDGKSTDAMLQQLELGISPVHAPSLDLPPDKPAAISSAVLAASPKEGTDSPRRLPPTPTAAPTVDPTLEPTDAPARTAASPASLESRAGAVLSLRAPMRLAPPVRRAIEQVISELNAHGQATASQVIAAGLFIALEAFERCGVPAPVGLRALADVGMVHDHPQTAPIQTAPIQTPPIQTASTQTAPTQTLSIGDREVRGVVISGSFIDGLWAWIQRIDRSSAADPSAPAAPSERTDPTTRTPSSDQADPVSHGNLLQFDLLGDLVRLDQLAPLDQSGDASRVGSSDDRERLNRSDRAD